MYLAAVWLKDHHLFGTTSINLGGKHLYIFEFGENNLVISREKNDKYIPGFFSDVSSNLSHVSSIVGKNGSGKTSLMYVIRKILKGNQGFGGIANEYSEGVLVFEKSDGSIYLFRDWYPRTWHISPMQERLPRMREQLSIDYSDIPHTERCSVESIYYSPFLDTGDIYIYSDTSPDIDISLSRIFQLDEQAGENMGNSESLLEHHYKNVFRHIFLQRSDFAKNLSNDHYVPDAKSVELLIRQPTIDISTPHNLPLELRPFFSKFIELWRNEIHATERRVTDETKVEEDRAMFKLWFLYGLIHSLFYSLEATNRFIVNNELRVHVDIEVADVENKKLEDAFSFFLDHQYLTQSNEKFIPVEEVKNLIKRTFEIIDSLEKGSIEEPSKIYINTDSAIEILKLEKNLLNSLIKLTDGGISFFDVSMHSLNLSSGEKAFLDLYSRFLLSTELIEEKKKKTIGGYNEGFPQHFILLIDEGDIGFHPVWKKKYVKSIINTLPKFYKDYKGATIQIVFSTHDALTLSDMPSNNIIYLEKGEDKIRVLQNTSDRPSQFKSFGANITTLLADSFFIDDGLVGEFAVYKIDKTIAWLNDEDDTEDEEYHRKVIELIDEPLIQRKLSEMFTEKTGNNLLEEQVLQKHIESLQSRLRDLNT